MCKLRRLTHKLSKAQTFLCKVCEWVARVYTSIKSTKITIHSYNSNFGTKQHMVVDNASSFKARWRNIVRICCPWKMVQPSWKFCQFKTLFCYIMIKMTLGANMWVWAQKQPHLAWILFSFFKQLAGLIEEHLDFGPTRDRPVFKSAYLHMPLPKIATLVEPYA